MRAGVWLWAVCRRVRLCVKRGGYVFMDKCACMRACVSVGPGAGVAKLCARRFIAFLDSFQVCGGCVSVPASKPSLPHASRTRTQVDRHTHTHAQTHTC